MNVKHISRSEGDCDIKMCMRSGLCASVCAYLIKVEVVQPQGKKNMAQVQGE